MASAGTGVKEFCRPESAHDVVKLLTKHGDRAVIVAGGTFLHGLFAKSGTSHVEVLIGLQQAGLSYLKTSGGVLSVGATTTFRQFADYDPVRNSPEFGAIRDALQYPPPQIRNAATVGGCLAAAYSLFDLPVALMALGSSVKTLGPGGSREIGLEKFFLDYFETALGKNEFLTDVLVQALPARTASAFLKLETNANDLALINVAARLTVDELGVCRDARVVVGGGIGKVPVRAMSCEKVLQGQQLGPSLIADSAQQVTRDIQPVSDHRASAQYRRAVAKVCVRRAIHRAGERAGVKLG